MTRPTPIGSAALRVIPLSPEQIADLVARVRREAPAPTTANYGWFKTGHMPLRPVPSTTRARCAARYAHLVGCSMIDAIREFGLVDMEWPMRAWRRMYPGEKPIRARYGSGRK